MLTLLDSLLASLLGTLVGDCLGAPYEGAGPVSWASGSERVARALEAAPLRYTDDTQLAFALAEHLAADPNVAPARLARAMLERIETDRGYGPGMLRLVQVWRRGVPPDEAARSVFGEGSFGNGAAMRIAPLGALLAGDPDALDAAAARSARLTHAHPIGVDGAVTQARAVAAAAREHRFGPDELAMLAQGAATRELAAGLGAAVAAARSWLAGGRPEADMLAHRLGTEATADRSVPAALWCAAAAADVVEAVSLALALGGDTDTIAAMAAAVRAVAAGADDVPAAWLEAVEDSAVAEAQTLAGRLADAHDRPSTS